MAQQVIHQMLQQLITVSFFQCVQKPSLINDEKDQEYKPHDIVQRQSVQSSEMTVPARRAKRMRSEVGVIVQVME